MRKQPNTKKKRGVFVRAIDGVVSTLSPQRGYRRSMAREMMDLGPEWLLGGNGGYRSARKNRTNEDWMPTDGTADEAILDDLPTLRARSQDAARNNADVAGAIVTMVVNVVATGIRLQSRIPYRDFLSESGIDEDALSVIRDASETIFNQWVPWADAAGRLDFYEMQSQVERSMLVDGEVIAIRQMLDDPRRPFETAVELVEASRLATPIDKMGDKSVKSGVKIGTHGEPLGYWIKKAGGKTPTADGFNFFERIDDATGLLNVLHLYHQDRPGQTRGVPMTSSQLDLTEQIERYVEAEVIATRSAACNALIVKTPDPFSAAAGSASYTQSGEHATERIEEMQPGAVHYLLPGQDVSTFQLDRPGTQFETFLSVMQRRFGTAWGIPFELIAKDFSKANYSSMRTALLQAYRLFRYRQQWLARKLCQPVYEWVLHEVAARGRFPIDVATFVEHSDLWTMAHWVPAGWEWIDPLKEAGAAEKSMGNYLSALVEESARRGLDWEQTLEEASRVMKKMEELGLPIPKVFQTAPAQGQGAA